MAREIKPSNLVLRCYGYRMKSEKWVGVCLEFNIAAEAHSPELLKQKLKESISSYLDTVFDTTDKSSIPELLCRRAPWQDYVIYYFIKLTLSIKEFPSNFTFKEYIPLDRAYSC